MHVKKYICFIVLFLKVCLFHPNCVEPIGGSYFPPKPDPPLQYCEEYAFDSDGACCTVETEMTYAGNVVPTIIKDTESACYDFVKKLYCSFCAPYAGHFFESEGKADSREYTWMCKGFCDRFWDACSEVPLDTNGPSSLGQILRIPGLPKDSGTITLSSLYPNKDEYCPQFVTDNPVSCYSDNPDDKKVEFNGPGVPYQTYIAYPNLNLLNVPNDKGLPLHITHMTGFKDNSNRVSVAFQHGVIVSFENDPNVNQYTILVDMQDDVYFDGGGGSEYGLIAVEFHPLYSQNGWVFVKHSYLPNENHLTRYTVQPDTYTVDINSKVTILSYQTFGVMHHGGQPQFGNDGYLYYPVGDGTNYFDNFVDYNPGSDPQSLLGKVLRIDVSKSTNEIPYTIPADNPFVGQGNWRPEIYAYGFRNPWRFFYDAQKDRFWIGSVGQFSYESVYVMERGKFHGWHKREGFNCYYPASSLNGNPVLNCETPGEVLPVIEFPHALSDEFCNVESNPPHCTWNIQGSAVIGGWVYRGAKNPSLQGHYLFSNFEPASAAKLYMVQYNEENPWDIKNIFRIELKNDNYFDFRIPTLGTDINGEIYIINYDNPNEIWTLVKDEDTIPTPTPTPVTPLPPKPAPITPPPVQIPIEVPEIPPIVPVTPPTEVNGTPLEPFGGVEVPTSSSNLVLPKVILHIIVGLILLLF